MIGLNVGSVNFEIGGHFKKLKIIIIVIMENHSIIGHEESKNIILDFFGVDFNFYEIVKRFHNKYFGFYLETQAL